MLWFSVSTRQQLEHLKWHQKNISAMKFSSGASKIISGSVDSNVIVWDWCKTESPFFILKGHKSLISALSMSGDDSRLFSGSRDRTVKMCDMANGRLCRNFSYDAEVESVDACPMSHMFAVGTRDGRLRCIDWISQDIVFDFEVPECGGNTALRFRADGEILVLGSAEGKVLCIRTAENDWYRENARVCKIHFIPPRWQECSAWFRSRRNTSK